MTNQSHIIGIDLGKHWFHLIGLDRDGAIVLRKKMSRAQLSAFAATASRSVVAMEATTLACGPLLYFNHPSKRPSNSSYRPRIGFVAVSSTSARPS